MCQNSDIIEEIALSSLVLLLFSSSINEGSPSCNMSLDYIEVDEELSD